jgi:hypothetical protein
VAGQRSRRRQEHRGRNRRCFGFTPPLSTCASTHALTQPGSASIIPSGRPTGMAADAGHSDSGRTGVGCAGTAFTSTRANFAIGWATALSVPSSRCRRHV